jgi:hypothetical protein
MTNPHIGSLDAAREQLVKQRRQLIEELAKPWVRGKSDDFRERFLKVQEAIAAIDEALKDEKKLDPDSRWYHPRHRLPRFIRGGTRHRCNIGANSIGNSGGRDRL